MKLCLSIFKKELEEYQPQSIGNISSSTLTLSYSLSVDILPQNPLPEVLYIIECTHLPKIPPVPLNAQLLILGEPSEHWKNSAVHGIYLPKPDITSLSSFFFSNKINQIFHRYQTWGEKMQYIVDHRLSMDQIGWVSMEFIENPIFVLSDSFRLLMHCIPSAPSETNEKYNNYVALESNISTSVQLSSEEILDLLADKTFHPEYQSDEAILISPEQYGYSMLFQVISISQTPVARVAISSILHEPRPCDYAYLKIISKFIKKLLGYSEINAFARPKELDDVLLSLLNRKVLPEYKIHSLLSRYGWKTEDAYVCILMRLKTNTKQLNALQVIALMVSKKLSNVFYTIFNEALIFIFNLSQLNTSREDYIASITPFLRDNLLTGYSSMTFYDFRDLYYYYQQALLAETYSQKQSSTCWYYNFSQCELNYLIHQSRGTLPVRTLLPEGLLKLHKYDQEKNQHLITLLKCYIEQNGNVAETARLSYLHRNTCIRHLTRIEQISGLSLRDRDTCFLLELIFRLQELL